MCLLIKNPADTVFDFDDIADFYDKNPDGIGVSWAENNTLCVRKALPKSAEDAWAFYNNHVKGKDCVWHWRMRTHGDVDLTQCHPYEVFGDDHPRPLTMFHNGILATGNDKDRTKSDTWWFIEDYIRPILQAQPELVHNPAFVALLEEAIGSGNKFIFMDNLGRTSIVNERAFVTYKGALLSNTYAWTSSKGGYGYKSRAPKGGYSSYYGGFDDERYDSWMYDKAPAKVSYLPPAKTPVVVGAGPLEWAGEDDYEPADAQDYATMFFEVLTAEGLHEANKELTFSEVEEYYELVGEDEAWGLLDGVADGGYTDQDVMHEINAVLLRAALAVG